MADLVEFLTAQLDHDEQVARAVDAESSSPWRWVDPGGRLKQALVDAHGSMILPSVSGDVYPSASFAEHVIRHDPARVLRQVAAYRRILIEHGSMLEQVSWTKDLPICNRCRYDQGLDTFNWPCPTVRALVSIYSDRPGYDPSWTVE